MGCPPASNTGPPATPPVSRQSTLKTGASTRATVPGIAFFGSSIGATIVTTRWSNAGKAPGQIRDAVLEELASFTRNAPREDDLTLLVLRMPAA